MLFSTPESIWKCDWSLHATVLLSLLLAASGTTPLCAEPAPLYSNVMPGLAYAHVSDTNQPWSIHIARLDRAQPRFDIESTLGRDHLVGLRSVAAQARSVPPAWGRPVAAVNGDFFVIKPGPYQGDPDGLQIIRGELVSGPRAAAFWVEPGERLHLGKVESQMRVSWPGGTEWPLGLNEEAKPEVVTLFTPTFGPSTRATNLLELALEREGAGPWLPLRASQTYAGRVCGVHPEGNTPLAPGRVVLTVGARLASRCAAPQPGTLVRFTTALSPDLQQAQSAIGGRPLLVTSGQIEAALAHGKADSSHTTRNPRTAVGFNDHYFFLVEVDGRQKTLSLGMTFAELAAFMRQIGCSEAMNLDGGGSSTFWLGGKIMNSPSDKHERSVANALVILQTAVNAKTPRGKDAKEQGDGGGKTGLNESPSR